MNEPDPFVPVGDKNYARVRVTIRGRELRWLSRVLTWLLVPLIKRRPSGADHIPEADLDRIRREVAAELQGGRSNPEFHVRFAERVAARFGGSARAP
jgi:hypothetical protein